MEFRKAFTYVASKGEINSGEIKVETAGYIPAQVRIEQIIDAGRRLVDYRKEQFDYSNGEDDLSPDIRTRSKSYDLADATQDMQDIAARGKKASLGFAAGSAKVEKDEKSDKDKKMSDQVAKALESE